MALAFGGWVWQSLGAEAGMAYLTGFFVEKSLAMDNVFVIAMIYIVLNLILTAIATWVQPQPTSQSANARISAVIVPNVRIAFTGRPSGPGKL